MDMSGVKGLLFDKDGTLLDLHATWGMVLNEMIWFTAGEGEKRLAEDLARIGGYDLQSKRFTPDSQLAQGDWGSIFEAWQQRLGPDKGKRLFLFLDELRQGKRRRASVALGDIRPTLERLAGAGFKIGIATNDAEGPARRDMEHIGVADLCDVIYGHDSHGAKPGPEMMAAFCAETGLRPDQVAMVGDTMTDLRFARNAGAHSCIGIIDPSYANQPFVEGVDVQVEHVDAIPVLLGL